MKLSSKLILCIVTICISFISNAQTLGIKAGYNLSTLNTKVTDFYLKSGFHIGATADFSLSNTFSIEPGLLFTSKGFVTDVEQIDDYGNFIGSSILKANLLYVEIPISIKATYDIGKYKIFWNAGPYISLGIGGNMSDGLKTQKIEWGFNHGQPRFDYGLTFGVGASVKSLEIGLVCDYGLTHVFKPNAFSDNLSFGISLGYRFGKK